MAKLSCKTKDNTNAQGKERVYFASHPDDFKAYFDPVCADIFAAQNCTVFYNSEPDIPWDKETMESELGQMQLIVIPITSKFLYNPNEARDVELAFAKQKHIPLLPLPQESGLEDDFKKICGELYFNDSLCSIAANENGAKLIQTAAEHNLYTAMKKMSQMYKTGEGVGRNYEASAHWLEKSAEYRAQRYAETGSEEDGSSLVEDWMCVGDAWLDMNRLAQAREAYEKMRNAAERLVNEFHTVKTRKDLSVSYNMIGDIFIREKKLSAAKSCYEKAFEIREQLANETGSPEARKDLSTSYNRLGKTFKVERNLSEAKRCLEKAFEIREQLLSETGSFEALRDLAVSHNDLGGIFYAERNLPEAQKHYEKAVEICKQLINETGSSEARRDLSIYYNKLGDMCLDYADMRKATEFYDKALEIRKQLADETDSLRARRDLSDSFEILCDTYIDENLLFQAKRLYEKHLKYFKQVADETNSVEDLSHLSISYDNLATLCEVTGNSSEAKEWSDKAAQIRKHLPL